MIAYSFGHFLNDIAASLFFTYFLYFMINIVNMDSGLVGALILIGQITDTVCTPIVGWLGDKTDTKIGKRKPWYIFGTCFQTIAVLATYQRCI